ncbi:hypothetical protein HpHA98_02660 [Helicobacter pylori]
MEKMKSTKVVRSLSIGAFNVKGFNKKALIKRNDEMREWLINTFFKDFATQ